MELLTPRTTSIGQKRGDHCLLRRSGPEQLIDATLNPNPGFQDLENHLFPPSSGAFSYPVHAEADTLAASTTKCFNRVACGHAHDTSDNLTMNGMHNGLEPVLCSKLVVDVVEMVAKCLRADPKFPCDFGRILTV